MLRRIVMLAALVACLGCEQPPMRGVIAKKNHRPAWTQFTPVSTGKVVVIVPIYHPEQWDIVIQADGTDDSEGRHLVVVSHEYWDACDVGDVWQRRDTVYED